MKHKNYLYCGVMKTTEMTTRIIYLFTFLLARNSLLYSAEIVGNSIDKSDTIVQHHFNIMIVSDLTNRLDRKSNKVRLKDADIIEGIMNVFMAEIIYLNGRKTHQNDRLKWSTLTPSLEHGKAIEVVNLEKFGNQIDRIRYLKYEASNGIEKDISEALAIIKEVYQERKVSSGDIFSYLEDDYVQHRMGDVDNVVPFRDAWLKKVYDDVIIVLTDGYLEYGLNASGKNIYEWGSREIRRTRQIINDGGYSFQDLDRVNEVPRIKALEGHSLKGVKVLCIGFHDRSASGKTGSARVKPEDDKINEYAWKDWLYRSGASLVEIEGHLDSKLTVETVVLDFLKKEPRKK